jgi:hypothetical protein
MIRPPESGLGNAVRSGVRVINEADRKREEKQEIDSLITEGEGMTRPACRLRRGSGIKRG